MPVVLLPRELSGSERGAGELEKLARVQVVDL